MIRAAPTREDAAAREALDWLIALGDAPGDAALRARFETWRRQSPLHGRAWREATEVDGLIVAARRTPEARARAWKPAAALAALAACLILALLPSLRLWAEADHVAPTGEARDIPLADGGIIHLAPGSAVSVRYGEEARSVRLIRGEAFFQVARDPRRPFTVTAGEVKTTVLGTEFDVRRTGTGAVVAVRSGLVRVSAAAAAAELTAGQWLDMDGGRAARHGSADPGLADSWRQGRLTVRDGTVADAVEVLRRHHGGLIVLRDDIGRRRITGLYDLADPAEALAAMVAPQGGSVSRVTPWILMAKE